MGRVCSLRCRPNSLLLDRLLHRVVVEADATFAGVSRMRETREGWFGVTDKSR